MTTKKDIELLVTSTAAQDAVSALIKMNDTVGHAIQVDNIELNEVFYKIIEHAYYFAAKTELDFDNIDTKLHDALLPLVIEARLAYKHFCKGQDDTELIRLLLSANYQATQQLKMLDN